MFLYKIAVALVVASLAAADPIPRIPKAAGGCDVGYRLTKKFCAEDDEPAVCCPSKGDHSCFNEYEKCIPQLVGCPAATFACPENYFGNCCPQESFCGTAGPDAVCFV